MNEGHGWKWPSYEVLGFPPLSSELRCIIPAPRRAGPSSDDRGEPEFKEATRRHWAQAQANQERQLGIAEQIEGFITPDEVGYGIRFQASLIWGAPSSGGRSWR
jgi:hypothetical protein